MSCGGAQPGRGVWLASRNGYPNMSLSQGQQSSLTHSRHHLTKTDIHPTDRVVLETYKDIDATGAGFRPAGTTRAGGACDARRHPDEYRRVRAGRQCVVRRNGLPIMSPQPVSVVRYGALNVVLRPEAGVRPQPGGVEVVVRGRSGLRSSGRVMFAPGTAALIAATTPPAHAARAVPRPCWLARKPGGPGSGPTATRWLLTGHRPRRMLPRPPSLGPGTRERVLGRADGRA